jgi:hypothetical protein
MVTMCALSTLQIGLIIVGVVVLVVAIIMKKRQA